VAPFLNDWHKSRQANAFGMAQWYFADSPGENGLYAEYQQFRGTPQEATFANSVRSLGASAVDMNRFPKLLYYAYQAAWTPFPPRSATRCSSCRSTTWPSAAAPASASRSSRARS
jgi:hypothetical protein